MPDHVRIGLVGGGLMGREAAAAFGRWMALEEAPVVPRLVAVCEPDPERRSWFDQIGTVERSTEHHSDILDLGLDVIYVAVPHNLHRSIYVDVLEAGIDLFGEKPYGIDLAASETIARTVEQTGAFSRCSSEMPFFPGAQFAINEIQSGKLGQIIEARCSFLHSSDIDQMKPINWKRQAEICGEIGVMGDLGMHVTHVPFRLGWQPTTVFAVLQDIVTTRPDGSGGEVPCDTIDNATLICDVEGPDGTFPLYLETKRIAPGQSNTWKFEAIGMDGGVSFSSRSPQVVQRFRIDGGRQLWEEIQPGHVSVFPTITGNIFEFGFPDALLQMWAAFLTERADDLNGRFGCATPQEAVMSHRLFSAALRSHDTGSAVAVQDQKVGPR